MNENPGAANNSEKITIWERIVRIYRILSVVGISIIMVILSWFLLCKLDIVEDLIIALGNFGSAHHFVIFWFIGTLWAFFVWYWAWAFYYAKYTYYLKQDEQIITGLMEYEKQIIYQTPWILGALALLIIGLAFLKQAPQCSNISPNPLQIIGIVFLVETVLFIVSVSWLSAILNKKTPQPQAPQPAHHRIVSVVDLPASMKRVLLITTIVVIILLIALIISPIALTRYLGDGVTVLMSCFCIWLPLLYWVRYFSLKINFPLFLVLAILIVVFSFFNGNANVRLLASAQPDSRMALSEYLKLWAPNANPPVDLEPNINKDREDFRTPLIIILSEGGGIRAAYWSAQMLARFQGEGENFRKNLFCISGVSGGSFGATLFDSLLDYYGDQRDPWVIPEKNPNNDAPKKIPPKSAAQKNITAIAGKDILSPTIACMLTREIVQLLVPVPIYSFDDAQILEKTWELYWNETMGDKSVTFDKPFLSLWKKDSLTVPALFLNSTQVENGYPVIVSNLRLWEPSTIENAQITNSSQKNDLLPQDFYINTLHNAPNDVRISTASLLSARFPGISPAGTLAGKDGDNIGLVDGGIFENTGANTAYLVLLNLEAGYEKAYSHSLFGTKIRPVVIYLQNGAQVPDKKRTSRTMLYQFFAPIDAYLQQRDSQAKSSALKLQQLVEFYDGKFITYSLQKDKDNDTILPLSWALSKNAQNEIDKRVGEIDISEFLEYIK
jgi:hypothetical protein